MTPSLPEPDPAGPERAAPPVICSSRGCGQPAAWEIGWNNPKIHTPDRRKVWTACDQHRDHLANFLRLRGFLRDVTPLQGAAGRAGQPG